MSSAFQLNDSRLSLRWAKPEDVPLIHSMIKGLADYEQRPHDMIARPENLHECLFGESPLAETILAFYQDQAAGFALFQTLYSTFLGKRYLYLEDIFILPRFRGKGIGKHLFTSLATVCLSRGYAGLEWSVLDWNDPAIGFYKALGATKASGHLYYALTGNALRRLSNKAS
ncbi:GNAT family N-acetyltransferase [Zooshikella harenae]|uniref:GNAT family N-acetyltransferase n=1 Tax=Zooshikella harenae TaxID=2827238 RepID=A0ABS5ZDX8_9GAMM|nr:GNAT family N-acetyltransferase [Zooshikella harenae]MBU2711162.1 GNAT family N-acetyltransferase [Zooshikella harenae]